MSGFYVPDQRAYCVPTRSRSTRGVDTAITDPYWANVSSLLHFDGVDGGTSITDDAASSRVWTRNGTGAVLASANPKFGATALSIASSGDSGFYAADEAALRLDGSTDFTIEAWVRPTVFSTQWNVICSKDYLSGSAYWSYVCAVYNGKLRFSAGNGTSTAAPQTIDSVTTLPLNTYSHVVFQRRGTLYELLLNGTRDQQTTVTVNVGANTRPLRIAHFGDGATNSFAGQIDEFRLTKGVARYTSSTYAVPTRQFANAA